ncbi:MAG TPA: carboxylating nicotinate-nucleotide diphosphorylase [Actinomycetota bacterium]|nr:carboxylating nicotinate-nucleotide diphosphorylase [Actinomycetota bacterium]
MGIDPAASDAGAFREIVRRALEEDDAWNDVTTVATVPADARGRSALVAKQDCVLAGLDAFEAAFTEIDPTLVVERLAVDGETVRAGASIARISGSLRSILVAERTALNFIQRLSGIATLTRAFVDAAGGTEIRDTRKTTPGLRDLEKAAVRAGGGTNHRRDLGSAILIKDNHIAAAGGLAAAVSAARKTGKHVEVECETLEQVRDALDAGADELLLDNMAVTTLAKAVALAKEKGCATEASGGVTLESVGDIAKTGVDSISVGALTHSARAIDLSLEVEAG